MGFSTDFLNPGVTLALFGEGGGGTIYFVNNGVEAFNGSGSTPSGSQTTGSGGTGRVVGPANEGTVYGAGSAGAVHVRYLGSPRATGGSIAQRGGYTIHSFTSSGTFTVTS